MSIKELASEGEWYKDLERSELPVVVEFYAPWCEPCKELEPVLKEAAGEFKNIAFFKYNLDKLYVYANRHNIVGIPTILMLKRKGLVSNSTFFTVDTIKGYIPIRKLKLRLESFLSYVIPEG